MSDVDPIAAVMAVLAADDTVSALVGSRVFGAELPEGENQSMPRAAVVVKGAGGPGSPGGGYQNYGANRIDFFCYGATPHEAWAVYLAVYGAMKQMRRQASAGVLLHSADCTSKGASGRDPVKQWPMTLTSFLVLASEVAAA